MPGPRPRTDPLTWLTQLEGVPSAMAGSRDGLDAVLRDRGLRRTRPEQTTESLLRGAHASAVLEGSTSSLDQVRAGDGDAVAQAALRVSTELLAQVPVLARSPVQALARLHALTGAPDPGAPVSAEAAARLQQLGRTVLATEQPALVVAALVHAEVVAAAPFSAHHGLVARAAERLVLVQRGLDPASVLVPEAGHLALRPAYEARLRDYATGGREGVHAWLLYAAEAYAAAAGASPINE
ncbi:oxidoreductase [Nocardioides aequoreus]|uniref:oxidoreductase n=1 Tax=Nocardioides aequoreus TaxID=397278 RepID=UPI001FE08EAB|nr:oxidoreductase [Nocardioides aequoreus]